MKTLDEVIAELTTIYDRYEAEGCFYCSFQRECYGGYCYLADALHYLKTYRENQQTYEENSRKAEEARERYLEAVKNCELAENKYRKLWKETSQNFADTSQKITCPQCHSEFVILPEANNALTWQELTQMEGKPVWVEYNFRISNKEFRDNSKRWCIIREFKPWHDTEIIITDNGFVLSKNEQVTDWQAYRKERG